MAGFLLDRARPFFKKASRSNSPFPTPCSEDGPHVEDYLFLGFMLNAKSRPPLLANIFHFINPNAQPCVGL